MSAATQSGAPGGFTPAMPEYTPSSVVRLCVWLDKCVAKNDALSYTALLQFWLEAHGCAWPKGVFKHDLNAQGSGKPCSDLGSRARGLHACGLGYFTIAKRLLPKDYAQNPEAAKDRIRKLIS